jgi:hypothetical protein
MRDIPYWILKTLRDEKIICYKCKKNMNSDHVRACGVRDSFKGEDKEVLFLEIHCVKCNEITIYEIDDMGLMEFAFEMMEEMERQAEEDSKRRTVNKEDPEEGIYIEEPEDPILPEALNLHKTGRPPNRPPKKRRSKITNKEIIDVVKFLNNDGKERLHDDFLIKMGMSPKEIDSYKLKKPSNDK